jgi:hypothetical protein
MRGNLFTREGSVALDADCERSRERAERKQQQPGKRAHGKPQRSCTHQRRDPGKNQDRAERAEGDSDKKERRTCELW